ncbi:hypothetical protein C8R41DRAFT_822073 [Lentinula lateritia]|uniref:Uncharacterized protein n=1 Tax=Lentinula lateritia TaxID=40482 RepID=A0ABQ8VLU5_9AGAR|nr:hypothetical protein C8R41DRAFT_822073 [Lentinula lateritia]
MHTKYIHTTSLHSSCRLSGILHTKLRLGSMQSSIKWSAVICRTTRLLDENVSISGSLDRDIKEIVALQDHLQ